MSSSLFSTWMEVLRVRGSCGRIKDHRLAARVAVSWVYDNLQIIITFATVEHVGWGRMPLFL